jgi:hypothetical protein
MSTQVKTLDRAASCSWPAGRCLRLWEKHVQLERGGDHLLPATRLLTSQKSVSLRRRVIGGLQFAQ